MLICFYLLFVLFIYLYSASHNILRVINDLSHTQPGASCQKFNYLFSQSITGRQFY